MPKPTAIKTRGAVIYIRVSTGEQAKHGTSLDSQLTACRSKAESLGLPIVAEYEDAGVSGGFFESRTGIQAALEAIRLGHADTLIATELDRLSRDVEHQQRILKAVRASGARLSFCVGEFEDTPEGDLNFGFQGGFKQYEKAVIRRRTMKGNRERAEQGIQPARFSSPFGYRIPTKQDVMQGLYTLEQLGRYVIIEEEAAIVRGLFTRYAAGAETLSDLCRWLEQTAIPTPRGAKYWHLASLRYLLTNSCYKGDALFGRYEQHTDESLLSQRHPFYDRNKCSPRFRTPAPAERVITIPCPALVSADLWEQVSERLRENRARRSGNPARAFMLAGHIYCPACGERMVVVSSSHTKKADIVNYYRCGKDKRAGYIGTPHCDITCYRVAVTEQSVVNAVVDACVAPEAVSAALQAHREAWQPPAPSADPREELKAIDRALEELKAEGLAAVQAQIAGLKQNAPPEAYAEVFAALAARRKDMEDRRGQLSRLSRPRRTGRQEQDGAALMLAQARRVLESPQVTAAEKREMVSALIERVTPTQDVAHIEFREGVFTEAEVTDGETLNITKTLFRKGGADATASAYAAGSPVAVVTRGLPSGLLMATIVSDSSSDAVAEKAALKPVSLVGTAVDVEPDKNILTIAPKTKPRQTIAVDDATKIKVDKTEATLQQITLGMRVSARLGHQKDADGHLLTTSLSAYPVAPKPTHKKIAGAKTP